jgi:predicted transcriptional regulator
MYVLYDKKFVKSVQIPDIYFLKLKINMMESIQILSMVRREMKRNHFSYADMARKLNVRPTSIQGMFSRSTIQAQKLMKLSEIFNYNFFREIAAALPYSEPNYEVKVDEDAIKAPLLERIKALEMEVGILRQTLKDVVTR